MATARPGMQDGRALTCYMQSSDIDSRMQHALSAPDSTQYRYVLQKQGHAWSRDYATQLSQQLAAYSCINPAPAVGCNPYFK